MKKCNSNESLKSIKILISKKIIDDKYISIFEYEFKIVIDVYYQKSHDETYAKYKTNFVS